MKSIVTLIIATCLLVSGCKRTIQNVDLTNKPIEYPLLVDINKGFDNRKKLHLSEIATDIEYVKLQFTEKSMISELKGIAVTDEYIFVKSYKVPYLMQFDLNGNFIRQIGTIGRGPEEYLLCIAFAIDETNRQIIIKDNFNSKWYFYGFDGKFLKVIKRPDILNKIYPLSTGETVCSPGRYWNNPTTCMLLGLDSKGDTTFIRKTWFFKNSKTMMAGLDVIHVNNDSVFYNEYFSDTIYLYNNRNMSPHYILQWDRFKDPSTLENRPLIGKKAILDYFSRNFNLKLFLSTPGNLYLNYEYQYNNYLGRFNKRTGEVEFSEGVKGLGCMENDYDGGLNVNPAFDIGNNKVVAELFADSLIRTLTPEYFAASKAVYPEKKEKLKRLVESLNENDNPVLMIITLK